MTTEGYLVDAVHVPSRLARSIDRVEYVNIQEWARVVVTTSLLEHVPRHGFKHVYRDYAFQLRTVSRPRGVEFELALDTTRHCEFAEHDALPDGPYTWRPAADLPPGDGFTYNLLKRGLWLTLRAQWAGETFVTERPGRIKSIRLI